MRLRWIAAKYFLQEVYIIAPPPPHIIIPLHKEVCIACGCHYNHIHWSTWESNGWISLNCWNCKCQACITPAKFMGMINCGSDEDCWYITSTQLPLVCHYWLMWRHSSPDCHLPNRFLNVFFENKIPWTTILTSAKGLNFKISFLLSNFKKNPDLTS